MDNIPFVWDLHYRGITSTLVGTNHFSDLNYQDHAAELVKNKDTLLLEIHPKELQHQATKAPNFASLEEITQTFEKKEKELLSRTLGLPLHQFSQFPAEATMIVLICKEELLQDRTFPIDYSLYGAFTSRNSQRDVYGLETWNEKRKFQRANLENLPDILKRMLKKEQEKSGYLEETAREFKSAYHGGNEEAVLTMNKRITGKENKMPEILGRDKKMVSRSMKYLQRSPTIIGVGALHCLGSNSMVEQYRERGVTVERVK